jgi:hypothetical protein
VSGLWEIFSRQVEFRDFLKFPWQSSLVVVKKYSNITMMYLQRRRKVFLFIIFQVKLLMIHMHRDTTSNVSSSILLIASFSKILITCLGISKCSKPTTHFSFSVKLGPVYGLKIRLISQIQSSLQYCPARS